MEERIIISTSPLLPMILNQKNHQDIPTPKTQVKYNKDGSIKKTHSNKFKGVDSEVFAFKNKEEIALMMNVFNKHIESATSEQKLWIARRNKLLFVVGINVGIRGSDLECLRWCDIFEEDGTFKDSYRFKPQKTMNKDKYVRLWYNATVKKAVMDYLRYYPIGDMNDFVFTSQKGEHIKRVTIGQIVKDAASECGIKQNINSHSLRKTWGYHVWHNAEDKQKALVTLQYIFNHSSTHTTMKYIGILDEDAKEVFDSLELGLDDIM